MTTDEIISKVKKSIVPERKLITRKGEIIPIPKGLRTRINCYAYILGAMCPAQGNDWYQPGFTTGKIYEERNKEDFLRKLKQDLDNLGFSYRELSSLNTDCLEKGEYMVRVFFNPEDAKEDGFHFIRKARKSRAWFHKEGWQNLPTLAKVPVVLYDKKGKGKDTYHSQICPEGIQFNETGDIARPIATFALKYNG